MRSGRCPGRTHYGFALPPADPVNSSFPFASVTLFAFATCGSLRARQPFTVTLSPACKEFFFQPRRISRFGVVSSKFQLAVWVHPLHLGHRPGDLDGQIAAELRRERMVRERRAGSS